MQYAATFKNNSSLADFGKIAIAFADTEGLVPTSGLFTAYLGLVDPNGFQISSVLTPVGTFGSSGTLTFNLDIPLTTDGKKFVPGVYAFEFLVKDGSSTVGNKTHTFTYDPNVYAVSESGANNGVQITSVTVSCENQQVSASIDIDDTGYTAVSNSISVLPAPTASEPEPSPTVYSAATATHDFVPEAEFTVTLSTTRIKTDTNAFGETSSIVVQEKLINVVSVKSHCDKWCALSECLLTEINGETCTPTLEKLQNKIDFLQKAVYLLLADKCGDNAGIDSLYEKMIPLSCGCGCK